MNTMKPGKMPHGTYMKPMFRKRFIFGNRWRNRAVEHPIAHAIHRFINSSSLGWNLDSNVQYAYQSKQQNETGALCERTNVDLKCMVTMKCVVTIRFPFICHSCHSWFLDFSLKPYRKWNQDFKNFLWPGMAATSLVHALSHHANRKLLADAHRFEQAMT